MAHEITPVENDLVDLLNKTSVDPVCKGFLRVDGVFMPESYEKFIDDIENFEVRDDDVWICSFPKTGENTWTIITGFSLSTKLKDRLHRRDERNMGPPITPIEGDLGDLLNKTFTGIHRHGWIEVDGFTMPSHYEAMADAVENFEVRDDDVWVASFPKTGTTWTQEMVWCIANGLDADGVEDFIAKRFPYLEVSCLFYIDDAIPRNPDVELSEIIRDSVSYVAKQPSPRFIKTHLPFNLLPRQIRTGEKNPKIIYVVRNPKDTCISFFHHCLLLEAFQGTFEDFIELFLGDRVHFAPFWTHALGYWKQRIKDNLLFLKYEDMKKDLPSVIRKTATFLGKSLTSDQVSALNEHLSLARMRTNPAANNENLVLVSQEITQVKREGAFIRSGTTEQWKTDMTPEVIQRFDDWSRKNSKGTGLSL